MKVFSLKVMAYASLAMAAGLVSEAEAATNVLRNGVLWESTFEGDVADLTTSTPAWTVHDRNLQASETTDGDVYSLVSENTGESASYKTTAGYSSTTARTVEIRARVPDSVFEAGDGIASLVAAMNGDAYDLRFASHGLLYNNGGSLSTVVTMDTSEFHVYRIVTDTNASPTYSLYIDGSTTAAFTSSTPWFTSAGFDGLFFGDISAGGLAGKIDVDYISWTDNGAFAPLVPEPSTLLCAAAGALFIAGRRRK